MLIWTIKKYYHCKYQIKHFNTNISNKTGNNSEVRSYNLYFTGNT